jgi:glycosyltransferase involved in cell wall biosynthesis
MASPGATVSDRASTVEFSVVIPVFNSIRYLKTCLDAVCVAIRRHGSGELFVVDNGSSDGSYELLQADYGSVATIRRIHRSTIACKRNLGARLSRGRWLSFIDSDCLIPEDYFERATAVLATRDAHATGCRYALPTIPPPRWIEVTWHQLHDRPQDGYVQYLNAGNFVISRAAFEAVAGFDESLETGEDAELGQRLVAAGFRIYESHAVTAVHLGNPKTLHGFFRQQAWHGLGQFATLRRRSIDKPVAMMVLHGLFNAVAVAGLVLGPPAPVARLALAAGLSFLAPLLTVLFRARGRLGPASWLRALPLYHLYYDARLWAAALVAAGRSTTHRR